jgi:hypothetical protein
MTTGRLSGVAAERKVVFIEDYYLLNPSAEFPFSRQCTSLQGCTQSQTAEILWAGEGGQLLSNHLKTSVGGAKNQPFARGGRLKSMVLS